MTLVVLTNSTLSNPANKTEVQQNFTDLTTAINGNLDNSNIAASAGIATSKLAANLQDIVLQLHVSQPRFAAAGWPAAGATTPLAFAPVPYASATDTSWVVTDISWTCEDIGGSAGIFDVKYGYYNAAVWTLITNISTGNTINDYDGRISALSVTLAPPNPIGPTHIAIMSAGADATTLTNAGSELMVSVRLRRALMSA